MLIRIYHFCFFILFLLKLLQSQNFNYQSRYISPQEGLSSREIFAILQDKEGVMWFGCNGGLNRYDGQKIQAFAAKTQASSVIDMAQDEAGKLWLRNHLGQIGLFSPATYRFETAPIPKAWQKMEFVCLYQPSNTNLMFFANNKGAIFWRNKKGKTEILFELKNMGIESIDFENKKYLETINMQYTEHQTLLIQYRHEWILEINMQGQLLNRYHVPFFQSFFAKNDTLWCFLLSNEANGAITKQAQYVKLGQQIWQTDKQIFFNIKAQNNHFQSFTYLSEYETLLGEISLSFHNRNIPNILDILQKEKLGVLCIYKDDYGRVWVGTNEGVYVIHLTKTFFQNYFATKIENATKVSCRGIIQLKDQLFVNSYVGIKSANLQTGLEKMEQAHNFAHFLAYHQSKKGNIWISIGSDLQQMVANSKGEYHYNSIYQTAQIENHQPEIWAIHEDKKGDIWLGTGHQFEQIRYQNGKYSLIRAFDIGMVSAIVPENETKAWLCSTSGLFELDIEEAEVKPVASFPKEAIFHLWSDQKEALWIATKNNGLICFHLKSKQLRRFTKENGLSDNSIMAVYGDTKTGLWISSNNGLMRLDRETFQVNIFSTKEGIAHEEFNRISHYRNEKGRLFLGGINGITSFYPDDYYLYHKTQKVPLKYLAIKKLKIETGRYETDSILSEEIAITANERACILTFSLLDYVYANIYSYKIEGWENEWHSQTSPDIQIAGLAYGSYKLHVRAQNPQGDFRGELVLPINVLPPFYLRWWFIVAMLVLLVLISRFWLYRRTYLLQKEKEILAQEVKKRTFTIEQQSEKLKSLDRLKSMFFANISHELRTPLTLILAPLSQILRRNQLPPETSEELGIIQRNAQKLLEMVNEILDLTKLENQKMGLKLSIVPLQYFLARVTAAFDSFAYYKQIDFQKNIVVLDTLFVKTDSYKLEKICNNLLSNAFKFTPKSGKISFEAKITAETLVLSVKNTGDGIHETDVPHIFERYYQSQRPDAAVEGGTGIGLALSREFAQLLGGDLSLQNEWGKGCTFVLTVPIKAVEAATEMESAAIKLPEISINTAINMEQATILIVEDNKDLSRFLKNAFEAKYKVQMAENGQEALQILAQNNGNIQLILSDVMMPVMDGFTLLEKVKKNEKYRGIPFILLTARAAQEDKIAGLRMGIDDYITKPFEIQELLLRAENLLAHYQQRLAWQAELAAENPSEAVNETLNQVSEIDAKWLNDLESLTINNLNNSYFNVGMMADEMMLSERQLQRKLKTLTGLSPNIYLREVRLQTARSYLENGKYHTIAEVAYAVGWNDAKYFSQLFVERFGKKPIEILR